MTATCIFCGASPTTNEHIIPEWMGLYLEKFRPEPRLGHVVKSIHRRQSSGFGTDSSNEWLTDGIPDFKVNCVCGACNAGWMSAFEEAAKPILVSLIEGTASLLKLDSQATLSRWLAVKAIVAIHGKPLLPQDGGWAEAFWLNRKVPDAWFIRISRTDVVESEPVSFWTTPMDMHYRSGLASGDHTLTGFNFMVAIRQFVGQVIGLSAPLAFPYNRRYWIPIWPHPLLRQMARPETINLTAQWPPTRTLNRLQIQMCSSDPAAPR